MGASGQVDHWKWLQDEKKKNWVPLDEIQFGVVIKAEKSMQEDSKTQVFVQTARSGILPNKDIVAVNIHLLMLISNW